MIDGHTFVFRIAAGEEYLRTLDESFGHEWIDLYNSFANEKRGIALGLALIHPEHYKHFEPQESIQGRRQFDFEVAQGNARCYADRLWGCACKSKIDGRVCGDHLFPYSLGGPTIASNKMLLCSVHNRMKSFDIHVYPWEMGEPVWLPDVIERIRIVMTRKR